MATGEIKTLLFSDGLSVSSPTTSPVAVEVPATGWDGATSTNTYDVSAYVADARKTTWTLKDGSGYEQLLAKITSADASHVTVAIDEPTGLNGTYYLYGVY